MLANVIHKLNGDSAMGMLQEDVHERKGSPVDETSDDIADVEVGSLQSWEVNDWLVHIVSDVSLACERVETEHWEEEDKESDEVVEEENEVNEGSSGEFERVTETDGNANRTGILSE